MSGVYCQRCLTTVLLEQDGRSCSNCGAQLVQPHTDTNPPPPVTNGPSDPSDSPEITAQTPPPPPTDSTPIAQPKPARSRKRTKPTRSAA